MEPLPSPRPGLYTRRIAPLCARSRLAAWIMAVILIWLAAPAASAAVLPAPHRVDVGGSVTTDQTWTKTNSPYRVTSTLSVRPGVTLTIEPGVTVIVNPGVVLEFNRATLHAVGTTVEPIVFTGATQSPGSWRGINLIGIESAPAHLIFDHVTVEYGGNSGTDSGNVKVFNGEVNIRNSIFRHSDTRGLTVSLTEPVEIRDTVFANNGGDALHIRHGSEHDAVLAGLTATGNGTNGVVYSSMIQESDFFFEAMGLPYILANSYRVAAGATLTIQPGLTLQMDKALMVDGNLVAAGSAAQPIIFTGRVESKGSWQGMHIADQATALLNHVTLKNGGQGQEATGYNLRVSGSSVVTLTNSLIADSVTQGVILAGAAAGAGPDVSLNQVSFTGNVGRALVCENFCPVSLSGLTGSDNGVNGIVVRGNLGGSNHWLRLDLPYVVEGNVTLNTGDLTIDPGVHVQFRAGANLYVNGFFSAVGTVAQPIRFTGTESTPGFWQQIRFANQAIAELHHCEVAYGGKNQQPMLLLGTGAVSIRACHLHDSDGPAIHTTVPPVALSGNSFERNRFGLRYQGSGLVDARDNWWGDISGPTHTTNPGGAGDPVSDRVLFTPWLTSSNLQTGGPRGLDVGVVGPRIFSPGETVVYRIFYFNGTSQAIANAVLRVSLPDYADYLDHTGNGIHWPARGQVFWRLGTVAPNAQGVFAVRMRYHWGLPEGLRTTTVAQLGGTGVEPAQFDVNEYLTYTPQVETASAPVSQVQVQARRNANSTLDAFYDQAEAAGYFFGSAVERAFSTGESVLQVTFLRRVPLAGGGHELDAFYILHRPAATVGITLDSTGLTVVEPGRALRYSVQTQAWGQTAAGSAFAAQITAGISWSECMKNCIEEKLPGEIAEQAIKAISAGKKTLGCIRALNGDEDGVLECSKILEAIIPGYGVGVELGTCNVDCKACEAAGGDCDDDRCHCCKEDKLRCDADDWLYGFFGLDVIKVRRCNLETGQYYAEEVIKVCAICEKCVEGPSGPYCTTPQADILRTAEVIQPARLEVTSGVVDGSCDECLIARDPNEIVGPTGDLLPGQWVTYTLHYENVGSGTAYDVFVVNPLSEYFDPATLTVQPGNSVETFLSTGTSTLYIRVGQLAPNGQPGSTGSVTYRVRLKPGLPSGTVVSNSAVVHFPSVPEETPTNVFVNTVQPLQALAQQVVAQVGVPLAIRLQGREASDAPLTFALVEGPRYGTLSGTLPNLTYTPAAHAGGRQDRLTFTVSSRGMTSRPADVLITVGPNPNDKQPPTVLWTSPQAGEKAPTTTTILISGTQQVYGPVVQIQFSEVMKTASLVPTHVQVRGPDGTPRGVTLRYDRELDQAVLLFLEPPQANMPYTLVITPGVTDLAGNPLAEFQATFRMEGTSGILYLPSIQR